MHKKSSHKLKRAGAAVPLQETLLLTTLQLTTCPTSPWHQFCYYIFDFLLRVILKKSENIPSSLDLGSASERKEKIKQPPIWWLFYF